MPCWSCYVLAQQHASFSRWPDKGLVSLHSFHVHVSVSPMPSSIVPWLSLLFSGMYHVPWYGMYHALFRSVPLSDGLSVLLVLGAETANEAEKLVFRDRLLLPCYPVA